MNLIIKQNVDYILEFICTKRKKMSKGKNIAYVRVSTVDQNEARQQEALGKSNFRSEPRGSVRRTGVSF